MSAGELRDRITLQKPTYVSDGMGGDITTFVDVATIWAKAWTVSSNEQTRIQKFKVRFRRVIRPEWIIKHGESYFDIVSIDPDEKKKYIYLTCTGAA